MTEEIYDDTDDDNLLMAFSLINIKDFEKNIDMHKDQFLFKNRIKRKKIEQKYQKL